MAKQSTSTPMREFFVANQSAFKKWLRDNGSEIRAPTNAYEVLRFTTPTEMGLIHRGRGKNITSINSPAYTALKAFQEGGSWRAAPASERNTRRWQVIQSLIARDGAACIFCARDLQYEEMTVEHFVPLTSQGPDNLANMMIACEPCNKAVGSLSAAQKIKFLLERRALGVAA
jgi:hypothetical protein